MKKTTLALWTLLACFLLTACNNKSKNGNDDYTQQVKNLNKEMAKEGDEWDVDEWEKKLMEYIAINEEFIDSDPDDDAIEEFNDARENIKEQFDNRTAQKAISNLMEDDDFVEKTEHMDRKFTKMLQKLESKKTQERINSIRNRHLEEEEAESEVEEPDYYTETESEAETDSKYDVACERLLTEYDLQYMSKYELKIMRNWIFARHGYIFQSDDMKAFFNAQPWYTPLYRDVTPYLSDIEIKNIDFIKHHE